MNIYISNLSFSVTDADLQNLFADYGEIVSARVIKDRETGRSRGFGFVEVADDAMGQKAIDELNQAELDGKVINVSVAKPREEKPNNFRGGFNRNSNGGGFRRREGGYNNNRGGGYGNNRGGGYRRDFNREGGYSNGQSSDESGEY